MFEIKTREVRTIHIDEINLTADQWDKYRGGRASWRNHMATLLNQRAKKLAPTSNPSEFYTNLFQFSIGIGFGSVETIVKVTEQVYSVTLMFDRNEAQQMLAALTETAA